MYSLPIVLIACSAILLPSCRQTVAMSGRKQRYDLQQGMTMRCEVLCSQAHTMGKFSIDLRPDCQRGCQYFNRQFLVTATDENIVTDLPSVLDHSQQCMIIKYLLKNQFKYILFRFLQLAQMHMLIGRLIWWLVTLVVWK